MSYDQRPSHFTPEMRSDKLRQERDELALHLNYWLDSQEPLQGQNDPPSAAHRKLWREARALLVRLKVRQA